MMYCIPIESYGVYPTAITVPVGKSVVLSCLHRLPVLWAFIPYTDKSRSHKFKGRVLYRPIVTSKHSGIYICFNYTNEVVGKKLGEAHLKVIGM